MIQSTQERARARDAVRMKGRCFPRMIAHHPYVTLTIVLIFSSMCVIVSLTTQKFPDFSDPQMVLETR